MAGMEKEVADRGFEAAQAHREQRKVSSRAADRLAQAGERHRAQLEKIRAEGDRRRTELQRTVDRDEAELRRTETGTRNQVSEMGAQAEQKVAEEEKLRGAQRQAMQQIAQTRGQRSEYDLNYDRTMKAEADAAAAATAAAKGDTKAQLDVLRQRRADIQAEGAQQMEARSLASLEYAQEAHRRSTAAVLDAEGYRNRAAMMVERRTEVAEAARSTALRQADLYREKAANHAAELTKEVYGLQVKSDKAVTEYMQGNAAELKTAREHCQQVKEIMAKEADEARAKIRQIEEESSSRARAQEDKIHACEDSCFETFQSGRRAIRDTEEQFRAQREACDKELQAVEQRLREVEQATRERVEQIMAAWQEGSRKAAAAVHHEEERRRNGIESMRRLAEAATQDCESTNVELNKKSAGELSRLNRRAGKVIDSTQAKLEEARRNDEATCQYALDEFRRLRGEPERISTEADDEIKALMENANQEEERLLKEADELTDEARATTKAARDEDGVLTAETAEGWSRLRKACFQLRMLNLHEFAQGIVNGDFAAPLSGSERATPMLPGTA